MIALFQLNYSLRSICWPKENKLIKNVLLILAGIAILAITSQLVIPFKPVPLTLQSATVLLIALIYGMRLGAVTVAAYLIAGACGAPVFAKMTSGLPILFFDPTSGYLLGFLLAALVSGYLTERGWGRYFISAFAASLIGAILIFSSGVMVLAQYTGWDQAFVLGVKPFLITESVKLVVISFIAPRFWKTNR